MTNEEFYNELGEKYKSDPVFFAEHALGVYTWSKMREIMNSVRDNKYTAVRACHGSSKTFTAAIIAIWFFNMFLNSKVITTAPTAPQVELLLWTEIGKLYRTSKIELDGECLIKAIKDRERTEHFAVGFATNMPARAEGWHAPEILFILDEAKGIEQWMWDSMAGALGGGHCRALAISTTDGVCAGEKFHSIFTDPKVGDKWNKIHIDIFDLPTFTNEKLITRDHETADKIEKPIEELNIQISGEEWETERREEWGKDSVLYLTKGRGEMVDETPTSIIKLSQVMQMFKNYEDEGFDDTGAIEVGVDVAREGDDSSVFIKRKGMKVIDIQEFNKIDTHYLADNLEEFVNYKKHPNEIKIKIDDTGIGGGLTDQMISSRKYENIIPVKFNQVAQEEDKYPSAISEMWFELKDKIDQISCPHNERIKAELVNRQKKRMDNKGRRVVEPKDEYKKRLGARSPDMADALLLCFYNLDIGDMVYTVNHNVY
jgi:hypothetical protein